jgi:hypothetical protein
MKISDLAGSRSWQSASLPGRFATSSAPLRRVSSRALRRLDHFADDDAGVLRMLLEPLPEQFVDQPLDHRPHFGGDELVLRLRGEFWVGAFDAEHAGEALAGVVAG